MLRQLGIARPISVVLEYCTRRRGIGTEAMSSCCILNEMVQKLSAIALANITGLRSGGYASTYSALNLT